MIGALLGAIIYGAIAARGFKTVLRSLLTGGMVSVIGLGTVTAMAFGGFGFETRLPSEKLIESVSFNASYFSNYQDITLTQPEDIHAVYELHSRVVEDIQNDQYNENLHTPENEMYVTDASPLYSYVIEYTLLSGHTMSRRYQLSEYRYETELRQILASENFLKASETVLNISDADFENRGFYLYDDGNGYLEFTREETRQLAAAYRQDLETVTPENYDFDTYITVDVYSTRDDVSNLGNGTLMRIKSNYRHSIAYLSESGILKRLEESAGEYSYTD